jgi:hypothetical protein
VSNTFIAPEPPATTDRFGRCDTEAQRNVASLTFEDLVTAVNGVSASRALVNILIDEQIGQQVGVRAHITSRHAL